MASSFHLGSTSTRPPNLLDLIPPPPTYPPSPPLLSKRKQHGINSSSAVASEDVEETARLLLTDEGDVSMKKENGYAKLKRCKNKVKACSNLLKETQFFIWEIVCKKKLG